MRCTQCGCENVAGASFCVACGAHLPTGSPDAGPGEQWRQVNTDVRGPAPRPSIKSKTTYVQDIIIVAAVALTIGVWAYLYSPTELLFALPTIAVGLALWGAVQGTWPGPSRRIHPGIRAALGATAGLVLGIAWLAGAALTGAVVAGVFYWVITGSLLWAIVAGVITFSVSSLPVLVAGIVGLVSILRRNPR